MQKKRICFVLTEYPEARKIGIHQVLDVSELARLLASNGHDITILYVNPAQKIKNPESVARAFAQHQVRFLICPEPTVPLWNGLLEVSGQTPYYTYEWLKNQADGFDIIYSADARAPLYFSQQAKKLGLHFMHSQFVVQASNPLIWNMQADYKPLYKVPDLFKIHKERVTVEWADRVVSHSSYLVNWLSSHKYQIDLPAVEVIPPLPSLSLPEYSPLRSGETVREFNKIVFLGAFLPRDGLHYFLNAVQRLDQDPDWSWDGIKIIFVGGYRQGFDARTEFRNLAERVDVELEIFADKGYQQALGYINSLQDALLVLPYIANASANCLDDIFSLEIPFIASKDGGIHELIAARQLERVTFESHPYKLYLKIKEIWSSGAVIPVPAKTVADRQDCWLDFFSRLESPGSAPENVPEPSAWPLVSVCIAHFNRPDMLMDALQSALDIDYPAKEIVIVDDGSTDQAAKDRLSEIQHQKFPVDVRVYVQPNLYLGASRNRAARESSGEYMLFMDDDNLAKKEELQVMVRAALYSKADIITCFSDVFHGNQSPDIKTTSRIAFYGADLTSGLVRNPFGDSNCLVKRTAFNDVGGFSEHFKIGLDDQEFFARSVMQGKRLYTVPEALYWYRINTTRMRQSQYSQFAGFQRVIEPYLREVPVEIGNILRYTQGLAGFRLGIIQPPFIDNKGKYIPYVRPLMNRFPRLYQWAKKTMYKLEKKST